MWKIVLVTVLVPGGVLGPATPASAWEWGHCGPWASSATFPSANPPGWYTNTYSYAWAYPWFAYYNYSHGPYANWMAGGGFATYATSGRPMLPPVPMPLPSVVQIALPADAKLLFNGTVATGSGATRTFSTPPLEPGQEYGYELTAELVQDGKTLTVSKRIVLHAGELVKVALEPGAPVKPK